MKEIPHYVFPTVFYSHPSAPLYWDVNSAKTLGAWLKEGLNEAQALEVSLQKNQREI